MATGPSRFRAVRPAGGGHEAGSLHEQALQRAGSRRRQGSFYTPVDVVEGVLDLALDPIVSEAAAVGPERVARLRVVDPACGSGNFVVAAARRISAALRLAGADEGTAARIAFGHAVCGVELDPGAAEVARRELRRSAGGHLSAAGAASRVLEGDALTMPAPGAPPLAAPGAAGWDTFLARMGAPGGFDLVVGNPPFLSQLGSRTRWEPAYAAALRQRFGGAACGYTDPAALFMVLGTGIARPDGGRVCLIEPLSFLSARDALRARSEILATAALAALWVADGFAFRAAVNVCAPLLTRGPGRRPVRLYRGAGFAPAGVAPPPAPSDRSWANVLASTQGLPDRELGTTGRLGSVATATADFRDQYYGLAPHVVDARIATGGEEPRLITAGLIDPATTLWGRRTTRFNKVVYRHPRVRVADLDPVLARWAALRLVPKILVATQTKVLEAVVDERGAWLPSVPVVTVVTGGDRLWHVGALLTSPPVTLTAARRHLGAALSPDALKLSARDIMALPLPREQAPWDDAADRFERASRAGDEESRRAHLLGCGRSMCRAFGLGADTALLEWWVDRLGKGRGAG